MKCVDFDDSRGIKLPFSFSSSDQLSRLHMILKPFMLRRVKKDVENELSDKVESVPSYHFTQLGGECVNISLEKRNVSKGLKLVYLMKMHLQRDGRGGGCMCGCGCT